MAKIMLASAIVVACIIAVWIVAKRESERRAGTRCPEGQNEFYTGKFGVWLCADQDGRVWMPK